jgi:hypothetical protein
MDTAQFIDVFLHIDKHLEAVVAQYGVWVYAILFAIIFMETGFVVTPFLPGDSLLFVAGAVAAAGGMDPVLLAAVLIAVPPDRSRAGGRRLMMLVGLRLAAFLALVACLLRPTFVATQKARQQQTLIVLADASKSMTVADGADGRTRWQELEAALAAAEPAARKLAANGDFEIEQMYVQYVRLARPRARHPLLLMHGGGLCGTMYETKPDGRPGWQRWFLQAGHDVFVADAVERGRASWARSPQFFQGEPVFRTKAEAWELFRIGAQGSWAGAVRSSAAHPDTLFPVAAFDQFMKQSVPRWASTEAAVQAAYLKFAQKAQNAVYFTCQVPGFCGRNGTY